MATTLAEKLGIEQHHVVLLLDAPHDSREHLCTHLPQDTRVADVLDTRRYDAIFLWPQTLHGLRELLDSLTSRITPNGAIWLVIPQKKYATRRGMDWGWMQMQEVALLTDLVDNRIVSLSAEEYATRFVIRRDRRHRYGG